MSVVREIAGRSIGKLARATSGNPDLHEHAGGEPNRAQRRSSVRAVPLRHVRRNILGLGRWRRHRYLSRRTEA